MIMINLVYGVCDAQHEKEPKVMPNIVHQFLQQHFAW